MRIESGCVGLNQHAYRTGRSTELALHQLAWRITHLNQDRELLLILKVPYSDNTNIEAIGLATVEHGVW